VGAYLAAYTLVGIDFYEWYLMPAYPAVAILAALGLCTALVHLTASLPSPARGAIGALLVIALAVPYFRDAQRSVEGFKQYMNTVERSRVLVGAWLRDYTAPDARVLTGAIGLVGYTSGRYLIDMAGLVTPRQMRDPSTANYYVLNDSLPSDLTCHLEVFIPTGWSYPPRSTSIWGCTQH
jgi:hypothetical protein